MSYFLLCGAFLLLVVSACCGESMSNLNALDGVRVRARNREREREREGVRDRQRERERERESLLLYFDSNFIHCFNIASVDSGLFLTHPSFSILTTIYHP